MSYLLSAEIDINQLTDIQLTEEWEKLDHLEEEIAVVRSAIKDECLARMEERGTDGIVAGNKMIVKSPKYQYAKVNIDTARKLGCTKIIPEETIPEKEVVDGIQMAKLVKKGVEIEGLEAIVYINIKEINKGEDS